MATWRRRRWCLSIAEAEVGCELKLIKSFQLYSQIKMLNPPTLLFRNMQDLLHKNVSSLTTLLPVPSLEQTVKLSSVRCIYRNSGGLWLNNLDAGTSQSYGRSLTGLGEVFCFIGWGSFSWMFNDGLITFFKYLQIDYLLVTGDQTKSERVTQNS